jgi:hypothetical protein
MDLRFLIAMGLSSFGGFLGRGEEVIEKVENFAFPK